ncbi:prolyl oligopeptidase family serine peptidase [Shewanella sp. GutDb-MelDb]|uniref:S9 family peptidase n=1 Tax=Shewanella sp. GutDb-MelDb TaxID=2058316 RepID=UPI000C79DDE8|nr:prolyl oligopeptidase family serine peptidase [Shewanella sp. GutDb-MelDb]PKG58598.1 S9 family peptidase [Shewanella sp. GutDb-MelDb]
MRFLIASILTFATLLITVGCDVSKPKDTDAVVSESLPAGVKIADFGSWNSPVTAEHVYDLSDSIGEIQVTAGSLYFTILDASNEGRRGVKRIETAGTVVDAIPSSFDIGSRVHEYGGAPFVAIGNSLFATKRSDQLLYRIAPNQVPFALTPAGTRHADCISNSKASRLICVREDHRDADKVANQLVGINLSYADEGTVLATGADFYSTPVISPDQTKLAWITWDHPNMPWDNTKLWLAELDNKGAVVNVKQVATEQKGSITQPLFSPNGQLYFVADYTNWWNIYRLNEFEQTEVVLAQEAEFAVADWQLGHHNYAFENEHTLIASYSHEGEAGLIRIDTESGVTDPIAVDFAEITYVTKSDDGVVFVGAKETPEKGIYKVQGRSAQLIYAPELTVMDPNFISRAESVSFTTGNSDTAHGYLYKPVNPDFKAPAGQEPPLVMFLHPGPTAQASRAFRRDIQYWTSRGFAVFDLNYRGSTGFGRDYRNRLYGNWGKSDVEDAVRAAGYLVNNGDVDGRKLAIRGTRAGGFTALSAVAYYSTFGAAVSYSGISDVELFRRDSHKFESHYLETLIGGFDNYKRRSAMNNLSGVNEPLLLIQGGNDSLIPAEQTLQLYNAVKKKGRPVAYLELNDNAVNRVTPQSKKRALESELSFYGQVFGFTPAGDIPVLTIENIENLRRR